MKNTNLNEILFNVEKVQNTDFACNPDYAYDIFGYPNGVKTRLNCCSDRYELVSNAEIFPAIRTALLDNGIKFSEKYQHANFARFYADYRIEGEGFKIGGNSNDIVEPKLQVRHSYNGLTKYAITFGYFRLVCANGLVIPIEEKAAFNLAIVGKHTESIRDSIGQLFEKLNYFLANKKILAENFNVLADKSVDNWGERLIEVLNVAGVKKGKDIIQATIAKEAGELYGGKVNDWLIYNGINQYIHNNDVNIKVPEVRETTDFKVIEFLLAN